MAKRKSRADREAQEKAALREKVYNIAVGAFVGMEVDEYLGQPFNEFAESIQRWMEALQETLNDDQQAAVGISFLDKFTSVDSATDWLYEQGVRA